MINHTEQAEGNGGWMFTKNMGFQKLRMIMTHLFLDL